METVELKELFSKPEPLLNGLPFWSWNGDITEEEMLRQVDIMKEMGFGGFFIHSRTGLQTEYLGDKWFELIATCIDYAKEKDMKVWLYDEDRWPSGTAGGMVTAKDEFRMHYLRLELFGANTPVPTNNLLALFKADLDLENKLIMHSYERVTPTTSIKNGESFLAFYVEQMKEEEFYNGNTYVDTLNKEATEYYIEITHEEYKKRFDDKFGKEIVGIFTDEPHRGQLMMDGFSLKNGQAEWMVPWNRDLPVKFRERFNADLISHLPELFLWSKGEKVNPIKWQFVELLQEVFLDSFAKPLYDWCEANNLQLTGHALHEDSLTAQVSMQGSLMRFYEYMHVPGIDILGEHNYAFWAAKQLQSATRQFGRKEALSELYGTTGWQMTMENHKAVGDWQALFGINIRCHHLSWYTMEGEAKRDYPASIFYQSAWWDQYHLVEEYYARLTNVLNAGQALCDVLVINPIESLWCQIYPGWAESLAAKDPDLMKIEEEYAMLFHWLQSNQIDFDYGDEEMMSRLAHVSGNRFIVGKTSYKKIVVPPLTTIRSSTLKLLNEFTENGGQVVYTNQPAYVDAKKTVGVNFLGERILFDEDLLIDKLAREVDFKVSSRDVFAQLRQTESGVFGVLLNMDREKTLENVVVTLPSNTKSVEEWNCTTGEIVECDMIHGEAGQYLLINFVRGEEKVFFFNKEKEATYLNNHLLAFDQSVEYKLSERNIAVLDIAEALSIGEKLEVLKLDQQLRDKYHLNHRNGEMIQPWYREKFGLAQNSQHGEEIIVYHFWLEEVNLGEISLALENYDNCQIGINGQQLVKDRLAIGEWIDPCFTTLVLPAKHLEKGLNTIELVIDFKEESNVEAIYLLGDFGVYLNKGKVSLGEPVKKLELKDISSQGLPFYSGKITYQLELPTAVKALKKLDFYGASAVLSTLLGEKKSLLWSPFTARIEKATKKLDLEIALTRKNTFGPLHLYPKVAHTYGPNSFVSEGEAYSEEPLLIKQGISGPLIFEKESVVGRI